MAIKTTTLVSLPLLLLFACSSDPSMGPDGTGPGGTSGGEDVETSTRVAGTYEVTSSFDLTSSPALPDVVADVVLPLTNFSENPTGTIIDLIKAADTPLTGLINSAPPLVLSLLESTLNNLIEDKLYANVPVLEQVTNYADMVATIVTDFDVVTTLQVGTVDEAGNGNASHALAGFAFDFNGSRVVLDTPELVDTLTTARNVSVNVQLGASTGSIDIGDHELSLPMGQFAVLGLDAGIQAFSEYDDLGSLLAGLVNCNGLAANIGSVCLGPVCVLNETQLAGFCEMGLDLVAQQVESRLANVGMAQIRMVGGQATVTLGAKSDNTAGDSVNAMQGGAWDTEFALGDRSLPVQSSFEATRVD